MQRIPCAILATVLAFLAGCASNTEKLRIGMNRAEVVAAMGNPTTVSGLNGYEILNYSVYEYRGSIAIDRPYHVRLHDGKVEAYGFVHQLPPMRASGVSSNNTASLRIGMTKDEAIAVMGKPEAVSAERNIEYLNYTITDTQGTLVRARSYQVRLVDGKVDYFGFFSPMIQTRPLSPRQ